MCWWCEPEGGAARGAGSSTVAGEWNSGEIGGMGGKRMTGHLDAQLFGDEIGTAAILGFLAVMEVGLRGRAGGGGG
jgi:hypothetical protein